MGSIAKSTFVLLFAASTIAPANAAQPCTTGAACTVARAETSTASARDRAPKFATTPIVSYSVDTTETVHAGDTVGGFSDVGEYGAFEPARSVRPPAPRLSLIARMRRAASRILSATASLPHF